MSPALAALLAWLLLLLAAAVLAAIDSRDHPDGPPPVSSMFK